jgi:hypothetical protein
VPEKLPEIDGIHAEVEERHDEGLEVRRTGHGDLGVTAQLNRWGQLALIVGMFVGRLDVLLLLSALYGNRPQPRVGYPREDVYI